MEARSSMAITAVPQSEHERLKMRWDQTWGPSNRPCRHDKTAVLQLSWKQPHDDLNVGPELTDLAKVFRDTYGFSVHHATLDARKAQQQALKELSTFVHAEDEERALLIIYYAGHGHGANVQPGDVRLEGKTNPNAELDEKTGIVWSKVETAIGETEADVLLIFDCCEAGRLGRPARVRNGSPKSYFQFLGACAENQTTMGPGEESFTKALIWALEELANDGSPFSTAVLRRKIMEHRMFPQDQMPILTERRAPYEHIMISVQGSKHGSTELAPSISEREKEMERMEHIDLRFHFEQKVDDKHIDDTAEELRRLFERRKSHWKRVSFLGKSSLERIVKRAASKWMASTLDRKSETNGLVNGPPCLAVITDLQPSHSPAAVTPIDPPNQPGQHPRPNVVKKPRDRSPGLTDDGASHFSGDTEVDGDSTRNDSICFHLWAIARTLQLRLSGLCSMIARWLVPHSDYERIPDRIA